jgi:hypothetical protein
MTCHGSVLLSAGIPDTGSSYADEGTAAHFLAEQCLTTGDHPVAYIGKEIAVWNHPESESSGTDFLETLGESVLELNVFLVKIDADFAANVNHYVQYVRSIAEGTHGTLLVEQRMGIGHLTGEDEAEGTSDAVILAGDELIVIDLKFGMGVEVNADDNKQLMIYALAAYRKFEMLSDFKQVRLVISQPRINHLSEWTIAVEGLLAFGEEVKKAASRVWAIREANPATDLNPSEKACQWCRARAMCPALDRFVQDTIAADFDDLTEVPDTPNDPSELSVKMKATGLVEMWIKAVRAKVEAELFAGKKVPGYKVVQGKKGNRKWINAEHAEQLFKSMKVKLEDMYDMTVISPTSAEKLQKAGKIGPRQWPKVLAEITQSEGKASVAPESDPRPALDISRVEDDFEDLTAKPDLI